MKKEPAFAELKEDSKLAIKLIREMVKLRDMLIHGNPIRYDEDRDAIIFQRVDRLTEKQKKRAKSPDSTHFPNRMVVRFKILEEAAQRCLVINDLLAKIRDQIRAM